MGPPSRLGAVVPNSDAQSRTSGSMFIGTSKMRQISPSQLPLRMSYSIVRAALVASVAWVLPSVNFHSKKLSTVPNRRSPFLALARAPSTLSKIHLILVAEKYGSKSKPVLCVVVGSKPSAFKELHISEVRRSCHTMALYTGFPVILSQTMVVSRWFVMPMDAMSFA